MNVHSSERTTSHQSHRPMYSICTAHYTFSVSEVWVECETEKKKKKKKKINQNNNGIE